MFRRNAKIFPKALGFSYIVVQILGALLAALVLVFFTNNNVTKIAVVRRCYYQYTDAAGSVIKTDTAFNCLACVSDLNCYIRQWFFRAIV